MVAFEKTDNLLKCSEDARLQFNLFLVKQCASPCGVPGLGGSDEAIEQSIKAITIPARKHSPMSTAIRYKIMASPVGTIIA